MKKLYQDRLLLFILAITLVLVCVQPPGWSSLSGLIHWPTIITLCGLLLTTTSIRQSGLMEQWAHQLIGKLTTERALWFLLIFFAATSAMVLTNDIALFLIIPFTLSLQPYMTRNLRALLVLETIAVNIGSALTPIGNPQNIYLWQQSGVSFIHFLRVMLVPTVIQFALLGLVITVITHAQKLPERLAFHKKQVDRQLAALSAGLLVAFLIAARSGLGLYALLAMITIYGFTYRGTLQQVDWPLILLFIALFIDTDIVAKFSFWGDLIHTFDLSHSFHSVLAGAGLSQLISNVPATLLLSHFTDHWQYLAWGVNIGGNGLIIASFANLITLRLARGQKIGRLYHGYAIPFLLITVLLIYLTMMVG